MEKQEKKKIFVTGISGQDGSILAEQLLDMGHEVYGLYRRSSSPHFENIKHIKDKIHLICGDITDPTSMNDIFSAFHFDEVYNLAAQSFVGASFTQPRLTFDIDTMGLLNILEGVRKYSKDTKIYHACHDVETSVVTENGIKSYKELSIGDLVYSINEVTGNVELKPILKIHEYDYNGQMKFLSSRRINQMVTPNHQILLRNDKDSKIIRKRADELIGLKTNYSLPFCSHEGVDEEFIYFDLSLVTTNCVKNVIEKMETKDFLYLLGLYIGDGWVKNQIYQSTGLTREERYIHRDEEGVFTSSGEKNIRNKTKSSYIQYAIPENDKSRNKIIEILTKYNFDFKVDETTVNFSCFSLARLFSESGNKVYDKHIPDFVWKYSQNLLKYLLEGLIGSDGHQIGKSKTYSTSSHILAKDISILCFRLGLYASISTRKESNGYSKGLDRWIKSTRPAYVIHISQCPSNKLYDRHIKEIYYNNKVWCLEIQDNKNFLIKRGVSLAFSGNSTSEMFGSNFTDKNGERYQDENTSFCPESPYAIAKVASYHMCNLYKKAYNMFICSCILMNHESERRGVEFVTRKITDYVGKVVNNKIDEKLKLGNLEASRDWGHASDYTKAMYLIMQQDIPDNYVICTGITHTIREFLDEAFGCAGLDWKNYIVQDPQFMRPSEVPYLRGRYTKAKEKLGWEPKIDFKTLVHRMVDNDIRIHSGK